MRYDAIDPNLFIRNRQRLANVLNRGSLAVFNANDIMPTSADGVRSFIQNTDFFFMSGIDQEESILLICPDASNENHREVLFLRETSEKIATWEGPKYTKEKATEISGVKTVLWTTEFESVFRSLVRESEHIYLNTNEHPRADVSVETRDDRFIKWCRSAYPLHKYERLAPIMRHLRAIKSPIEVDLIRKACAITESAFRRLLEFIRPGVWEFEIEAEITHEFLRNRSRGPAYEPIVASGPNACILHSVKNDRQCRDGELVLMDFGAEYANYASDLSRTVPVNGRFTARQRAVYDAVLRVQRGAIDMLRAGNTLKEYHKAVGNLMETELIDLGLLDRKEVKDQDPEKPLYKKFYMHGASHHMGLDVHDVADLHRKFAPGMVFTCEPGIYIKEEGIGVRIENDIQITKGGPVDLMADIPVEAEEIEMLMNR